MSGSHLGGSSGDFRSTTGTLTFNPGTRSLNINVPIVNDSRNGDNVSFTLALSSPTGATLGTTTSETVTITNTNPLPHVKFQAPQFNATEGNANTALVTVTLDHASERNVTVHYKTQDCACGLGPIAPGGDGELPAGVDPAVAGVDYTNVEGDVTIPYGQTSAAFSVPILDDQQQDPNEGFRVVLTAPTNAVLTNSQGQPPASGQALAGVVIQDDHTTQTSGSCGSGKPTQQTFGDGSTRKETRHRLITPARG